MFNARPAVRRDDNKPVTEIMSRNCPQRAAGYTLKEAERLLHEYRIEKLPLVDADGKVAGLVTLKDIMKITQFPKRQRIAGPSGGGRSGGRARYGNAPRGSCA
jgi:CBS-domain-containing membrane protein